MEIPASCRRLGLRLVLCLEVSSSSKMPGPVAMELGHVAVESGKKSKKIAVSSDEEVSAAALQPRPESEKKKKKKEKKVDAEAQAVEGSTVTMNGDTMEVEPAKVSKKKRAKSPQDDGVTAKKIQKVVEDGGKEAGAAMDPMSVSNFSIGKALREKLKSKGIEALFPIQAQTFEAVFEGNDMVGRARTGQVVLPLLSL